MNQGNNKITIKDWAEEDRPREKLQLHGRRVLSDAELIAILIGSGNKTETAVELSKRILNQYNNDLDLLSKASIEDFLHFNGIGEAKAISIIAALELGRRKKNIDHTNITTIQSSHDVYLYLLPYLIDLQHEEFWILLLDRGNRIKSKELISKGGVSQTIADPKIIFKTALQKNACSIILAHNHPSGNLQPSPSDLNLTRQLQAAGNLLEIFIMDHIILTDKGYFSFKDDGIL